MEFVQLVEKIFSSHDTEFINKDIEVIQDLIVEVQKTIDELEEEKKAFENAVKLNESKKA